MKTILACTDGAVYAPSVYQYAAWAAGRLESRVEVLNVYPPAPPVYMPPADFLGMPGMGGAAIALPEMIEVGEEQEEAAALHSREVLNAAAVALQQAGVENPGLTSLAGTLPEVLETLETAPGLIILGKRGEETAAERQELGAQLETVIRQSTHPVLAVSREFRPVRRFLISFDDSPAAHAALKFVVTSPLLKGLACDVVMAGEATEANRAALDSAATYLRTAGFEPQEFLMEGDPETVNAWEIVANGIDLLVMGAYSHSRFLQFFIGSTTTEMIRNCRVPVLVMGGKAKP